MKKKPKHLVGGWVKLIGGKAKCETTPPIPNDADAVQRPKFFKFLATSRFFRSFVHCSNNN